MFGGPTEAISEKEITDIIQWLNGGGRVLLMFSEGDVGDNKSWQKLLDRSVINSLHVILTSLIFVCIVLV